MSLNKKAVKGVVVNFRELSVEELTQVGGAYSGSDSGAYDMYGYDNYDYGGGGGDYYGEYDYSDYDYSDYDYGSEYADTYSYDPPMMANDPSVEITMDGAIQRLEGHYPEAVMSQADKAAYDNNYLAELNRCWNAVSGVEAAGMAAGGSFANGFADTPLSRAAGELSPGYFQTQAEITNFTDRAKEVGFKFAYCEAMARNYANEP